MILVKSRYLSFIDIAMEVSIRLPNYSGKFSNKIFTQRQLMTLYILKQKSKLSYDEFIDDFKTRDCAIADLQLKRVPSSSALKMFIKRIDNRVFEEMIVDCIGLTKKRKNIKLSCCAETRKHLFLSVKIRKKNRHDSIDFKPLIKKAKKGLKDGKKIKINTVDKAFDDEELHEFAENEGIFNIAPLREKTKQYYRIRGKHRKKLFKNFPKRKYHRRSIIESMFFRVKRLCGNVVRSKKWMMQKKEMLGKILAYNIHRLVQLIRV